MENKVDCLGVPTSCHQINQQFQACKDRNDVHKAWKEFCHPWGKPAKLLTPYDCIAFAVFFAERVKGGPL